MLPVRHANTRVAGVGIDHDAERNRNQRRSGAFNNEHVRPRCLSVLEPSRVRVLAGFAGLCVSRSRSLTVPIANKSPELAPIRPQGLAKP